MKPEEPKDPGEHVTQSPRKPYQKPRVEVYGDLTEIAKTLAAGTKNDGSGHPNKHFTS